MGHVIDHTWRKDTLLPVGRGYSTRPNHIKPTSIVIHTTNSPRQNTAFDAEARFLQTSIAVSSHYLVGKQGQIAQILHPDLEAYHAGGKQADGTWTAIPAFANDHSIGVESHVSQGETWTGSQRTALTWLIRWLMSLYKIPEAMIETHRKIALPKGRKSDPEAWPDDAFYAWRAVLELRAYRSVTCAPVFQDRKPDAVLAGSVSAGAVEQMDDLTNGWLHLASELGFTPAGCWEAI